MRGPLGRVVLVGLGVLAGLGAGVVWVAARGGGDVDARPSSAIDVATRIQPRGHAFGDAVVGHVVVVVDPRVVVPESVRIDADFEPYQLVGDVQRTVEETPSVARFAFRYPLVCLREACAPSDANPFVELPLGRVLYRFRGDSGRAVEQLDWPPIEVATRVSEQDVEARRWRANVTTLPEPSYRVSPGALAALLLAAAALLVLLAAALAWRLLAARRPDAALQAEVDPRSPLERAVEVAQLASLNGALPERRRALERVARELAGLGRADLAERARTLAWSPRPPSGDAVDALAREARAAEDGGSSA